MSSLIFTHAKEFIRPQYTMEKKSHRTFSKSINYQCIKCGRFAQLKWKMEIKIKAFRRCMNLR